MSAVIFDCDGVLVDSEVLAEDTLEAHLKAWLPDVDVARELGQALGMTTSNILRHLQTLSRHTLPDDAVEQVDTAIEARLARELRAIDGAFEAISAIPFAMAVVSNSNRRRIEASLDSTGLAVALKNAPILSADQVPAPKPDPAIYRLAAQTLGVSPHHCLAVEDSVAGVRSAVAAGLTVVGFVGASHIGEDQADRLVEAGAWQVAFHMRELGVLIDTWHTRTPNDATTPSF
ncbi:HAD family hydrolase [Vreelandella sp. EE7]